MWWLTRVRSQSMAPTLRDGQLALTRKLRRTSQVRRGDLVVADSAEVGGLIIKRVVGLPGELVSIHEGNVSIDGHPLSEPYAGRSVFTGSYQVPSHKYLLLGDNRDTSADSRTWRQPYLDRTSIQGRIESLS